MYLNKITLYLVLFVLAGCGNIMNDLNPSGADKRPPVQQGTIGPAVGQNAPDFTISDTLGNPITLSSHFSTAKGVVLYFTMWCPACDSQMSNLQDAVIPQFPNVLFFSVDYVSGSVAESRNAQISNGYATAPFAVLADTNQTVLNLYQATMGTTVVIDSSGVVLMNEDYKDGTKLQTILRGLP